MSTQLELDINSVDLDIPLAEQPEIVAFLRNEKEGDNFMALSQEPMYRVILLVRQILEKKYSELSENNLSVSLSYRAMVNNSEFEKDFYYMENHSISDANRFHSDSMSQGTLIQDCEARELYDEKRAFFEKVSDWTVEGIFNAIPSAKKNSGQIGLSFIWREYLTREKKSDQNMPFFPHANNLRFSKSGTRFLLDELSYLTNAEVSVMFRFETCAITKASGSRVCPVTGCIIGSG